MSRKLGIIAAGGVGLGLVLLVSAAMVGGNELRNHDWDIGTLWGEPRCDVMLAGTRDSRALNWTGGERVRISLPANVRYVRGQGEQVIVEGDAALVKLVEINNDRIRMSCRMRNMGRLDITLPGREFSDYDLAGSLDLTLENVDQARLSFDMAGSVRVTASGKVDELDLDAAGSSKGHFGALDAGSVDLDLAGSSVVEVAPREKLSVDAAGSTEVTLTTEPRTIDLSIAGSGRITHPDGTVTRANGFTSRHIERGGSEGAKPKKDGI